MKVVMVLLSMTAAILAAPSPDPQYTVSWSQGSGLGGQNRLSSWGFSEGDVKKELGKEGDGRREFDGKKEGGGRGEDGRREGNDGRDGGNRDSVFGRESEGVRSDDSKFPFILGREGLGYMKRDYRSLGMRFPITPEVLEPLGNRDTLKELYYVPLNRYNYL